MGVARPRRGEKVYESVARELLRDIRAEGLEVGASLPSEAEMLAKYQVGRASLREALRVLEMNGLITIKAGPGGGPTLTGVDSAAFGRMASLYFHLGGMTINELIEARLVIEPVLARLAAERRDPERLAALRRAVEHADAADLGSDADYLATSNDLHALVAGMSGNGILNLLGTSLLAIFQERVKGILFPPSRRMRVRTAHAEIAAAIEQGDADRAESLMREHMLQYGAYARKRHPALSEEVIDWR